ncbi:ATG8-interacting protein 1 isoform X2 [Brachypodium distachyon]|uniref:ATG8-interacting protein 1 isoform X2 n=1 Tax=Brachypodium distachyon TaxID=15368 RepID=UPI00071C9B2F|nr:ATG8-interacting protein 1 isoform X2 [Brachypodium distachyon]|eukprot:XP_014756605.1 ATG8-interacting protein 1 isoform X2 [Brachypodium distachyon]
MEPDHTGAAEQNSPRGNDWEVVQLTASNYASAPGPPRSEPYHEEEAEGQAYGAKGDDSAAAALLMSGHFSVSQNEAEDLLKGADSKERQEVCGSQYAVSDKGGDDVRCEEKKLKDDFDRIPSFDKGKGLSSVDMESDDGNTLHGVHLASEDPVKFSSHGDAEKELSWSATESKTEEPITLHNLGPAAGSSKVASGEHNKPDGSGVPRDAWWRKQLISLYRSAKESNKLWPIFVAAAALMGMAYFRRRWQKGKLQLQQVKLQPASSKECQNFPDIIISATPVILSIVVSSMLGLLRWQLAAGFYY